jgi:hypothetical protein
VQAVPVIFTAWPLGPGGGTANIPSDAIHGDRALVARPEKEVESVARTATAPFGNKLSSANSKPTDQSSNVSCIVSIEFN